MVIRIGMIGLSASDDAWSVMAHVKPLLQEPLLSQYKITAIATSSVESSAASAKRWGVPVDKAYVTAEDIANDPDVDLVVVNVKLPHHRDLAMPVLKVGKDVFVEWPLATTLDEVAELQAAARKSGARTFVGLQARTAPFIQKAKEIIESGGLGRIISSTIVGIDNILLYLPPKHDYEHNKKTRANISMITSGHILDAQSLLLGEYSTVYSPRNCSFPEITTPHHSGPIKRDAPDSFMVQGILTSGAVASMSLVLTTSNNPSEFTWTISGEKGALRMEGPNINIQMLGPKLSWYHDGKWEEVALRDPLAFGQVGDLYHAIASGKTLPDSIVDFDGAAMRHRMLEEERRRGYTTVIPLGINHKAPISQQLLKSSS